jgi:5'-nucleotidase / UDP-sugar diphosphatase
MRPARSLRTMPRGLLIACTVLTLGVMTGCGGTAAQPTATVPAPTVAAAAPAASPARPPLAAPSPSPAATIGASPVPVSSAEPEQTYEVKSGDTLLSIAEEVYGDATKWRKIYDANKDTIGADPDKLKLEQKLKIPPKDS